MRISVQRFDGLRGSRDRDVTDQDALHRNQRLAPPHALALQLQQAAGNRAVTALVQVQRCFKCNDPTCSDPNHCKHEGSTYGLGQHGNKGKEQGRLERLFGQPVSGDTHQSEHPIGFAAFTQGAGLPRGKSQQAKEEENKAPAYQEEKKAHRAHPGTGSGLRVDESGFNSKTYRDAQNALLRSGDASSALQINNLGYAFLPEFRSRPPTEAAQAEDSYRTMVQNTDSIPLAIGSPSGPVVSQIKLDFIGKSEAWASRRMSQGMDRHEAIAEAYRLFNPDADNYVGPSSTSSPPLPSPGRSSSSISTSSALPLTFSGPSATSSGRGESSSRKKAGARKERKGRASKGKKRSLEPDEEVDPMAIESGEELDYEEETRPEKKGRRDRQGEDDDDGTGVF